MRGWGRRWGSIDFLIRFVIGFREGSLVRGREKGRGVYYFCRYKLGGFIVFLF